MVSVDGEERVEVAAASSTPLKTPRIDFFDVVSHLSSEVVKQGNSVRKGL